MCVWLFGLLQVRTCCWLCSAVALVALIFFFFFFFGSRTSLLTRLAHSLILSHPFHKTDESRAKISNALFMRKFHPENRKVSHIMCIHKAYVNSQSTIRFIYAKWKPKKKIIVNKMFDRLLGEVTAFGFQFQFRMLYSSNESLCVYVCVCVCVYLRRHLRAFICLPFITAFRFCSSFGVFFSLGGCMGSKVKSIGACICSIPSHSSFTMETRIDDEQIRDKQKIFGWDQSIRRYCIYYEFHLMNFYPFGDEVKRHTPLHALVAQKEKKNAKFVAKLSSTQNLNIHLGKVIFSVLVQCSTPFSVQIFGFHSMAVGDVRQRWC